MKRIKLLVLALIFTCLINSPHVKAASGLIANTIAGSDAGHATVTTSGINTTGANLLIIGVGSLATVTEPSVNDSNGNSWTQLTTRTVAGSIRCSTWYSVPVTVGAAHTFSTTSIAGSFPTISVIALSGMNASPSDVENGATNTSVTSLATGSITPSSTNNASVSFVFHRNNSTSITIDSSFTGADTITNDGNHFSGGSAYKLGGLSGSENPTWSWTSANDACAEIVSFKIAAASGITASIRHEINILDSLLSAATGASATSNEIVHLDTTKYNSPTYYFEIVGDTSLSLSVAITLRRSGTSTDDCTATIPTLTTAYTLVRSSSCTLATNDYVVFIPNTAGATKNVKEARIIIIDNGTIANSQVQVEVGNNEAFTATSPSALAAPKYWTYTTANWDGSPTFYAEVSYKSATNTHTDTISSTQTWTSPYVITSVAASVIGGGASGSQGSASQTTRGGGGGGGGAFVKKNSCTVTINTGYSVTVGATQSTTQTNGNNSSMPCDGGTITGLGGSATSSSSTGGAGGVASGGDTNNNGGAGGTNSNANNTGGAGGGESGCSTGVGNTGTANSTTTGGAGGTGCDGGDGGRGGDNSTNSGIAAGVVPGGGGGGAGGSSNTTGNGAAGQVSLAYTSAVKITLQEDNGSFTSWTDKVTIVSAGVVTAATRVRSSSFTPTNGAHYRIAVVRSDSGISPSIYNAKIVIDQTSPTKLEEYYQLGNTSFAAGTGLQLFLTKWDSTEWSGFTSTLNYYHVTNSAAGTSVIEADTAGGTQITSSSVTGSSVLITSSALTMPANGNLDTKATTNNNDVYGNYIKVVAAAAVANTKRLTLMGIGEK